MFLLDMLSVFNSQQAGVYLRAKLRVGVSSTGGDEHYVLPAMHQSSFLLSSSSSEYIIYMNNIQSSLFYATLSHTYVEPQLALLRFLNLSSQQLEIGAIYPCDTL